MDPTKIVGDVKEIVDDSVYSRGEWETDRTARHLADMQSDNWLSKSVRPMIAIWAIAINSFLWIGQALGLNISDSIINPAQGVLITVIGFYFVSRGAEKVFSKRSAASIQIEKMKTKHEIREERKASRKNKSG